MPCHGLAEQTCYFCSCQCLFTCCPHACTRVDTFHLHLQPSCSNAPCSLPPLYGLAGSIMELALEAVKSTNFVYYEDYQYTEVAAEGSSMAELPLVPASRTKKNYKEFFQVVSQISAADLQAIHVALADGKLNIAAFPDSVRQGVPQSPRSKLLQHRASLWGGWDCKRRCVLISMWQAPASRGPQDGTHSRCRWLFFGVEKSTPSPLSLAGAGRCKCFLRAKYTPLPLSLAGARKCAKETQLERETGGGKTREAADSRDPLSKV